MAVLILMCWYALIKLKVLFFKDVRKRGMSLVRFLLDLPETGNYFSVFIAVSYK